MTDADHYLMVLDERREYLYLKLNDRTIRGRKTFIRAEHRALVWALNILTPVVQSQRPLTPEEVQATVQARQARMAHRIRGMAHERAIATDTTTIDGIGTETPVIVITARSSRTLFTALAVARVTPPTTDAEMGERFLDLLVAGIDHELVGTETWLRRILDDVRVREA